MTAASNPVEPAALPDGVSQVADVWRRLRTEAQEGLHADPALALLYGIVTEASGLREAIARRLSMRLASAPVPVEPLSNALLEAAFADDSFANAVCTDALAVLERDPAAERLIEPFLFFKGFAAIQAHRLTHWFWNKGKRDLALYLQSRASEVFQTDIHPAAQFGVGILLDHATGFVAGETVIVEDNVSILHGVTLGGTGTGTGRRHPHIRTGVLIGAGAQILGNVEIGSFSKVASGSLVTQSVPPRSTAAGVPARILPGAGSEIPAITMDQTLNSDSYESFTYVI
jgi:serine O-acetyltransferase